jgi:hypothetical protein
MKCQCEICEERKMAVKTKTRKLIYLAIIIGVFVAAWSVPRLVEYIADKIAWRVGNLPDHVVLVHLVSFDILQTFYTWFFFAIIFFGRFWFK